MDASDNSQLIRPQSSMPSHRAVSSDSHYHLWRLRYRSSHFVRRCTRAAVADAIGLAAIRAHQTSDSLILSAVTSSLSDSVQFYQAAYNVLPHSPTLRVIPAMSATSSAPQATPPTSLPLDPRSLSKYLKLAQLKQLQHTYHQSITKDQDLFAFVRWSTSKQALSRAPSARHLGPPGPDNSSEPSPKRIRLGGSTPADKVDSGHAYNLKPVEDMTQSSDSFYYGPHPAPPPHAVRLVLDASKGPRMFDPDGVSVSALLAAANAEWELSSGGVPGTRLPPPEVERASTREAEATAVREREEAEAAWENEIIASLSAKCAARVARGQEKQPGAHKLPPPSITHPAPGGALQPVLPPSADGPPAMVHAGHGHGAMAPAQQGSVGHAMGGPGPAGPPPHHAQHGHGHAAPPQVRMGGPAQQHGYGGEVYGAPFWRGSYGER